MIARNLSSEIPLFSRENRTCTELEMIVMYDFDTQKIYISTWHSENWHLLMIQDWNWFDICFYYSNVWRINVSPQCANLKWSQGIFSTLWVINILLFAWYYVILRFIKYRKCWITNFRNGVISKVVKMNWNNCHFKMKDEIPETNHILDLFEKASVNHV